MTDEGLASQNYVCLWKFINHILLTLIYLHSSAAGNVHLSRNHQLLPSQQQIQSLPMGLEVMYHTENKLHLHST
jgi:hypothetical protein